METPEASSDAELIARVRAGDLEAYGELFGRHHQAAVRMARQLVPPNDADDLAGDAFAKVLDALRGGSGPDLSFRAYLLTTVRRVHVDRLRSGRRVQSTGDIAAYEQDPQGFEDPTVIGFESGAAAKAFASLPERWQAVLWHTEVEGEKPATVAPLLGLTPNGVSALAYRAREGLRQAYLQQHLADVAADRCRWTTERLGAYVRGGLTKRENHSVREHLDECARCTAVYLELVEINSSLPALLAPALLGTAGVGYLAATSGAQAGVVGLLSRGWHKATENTTRSLISAGAATVVVAAVILATLAVLGDDDKPPAAINDPSGRTSGQPGGPTAPPADPTATPSTGISPTVQPTGTGTTGPAETTAPTNGPSTGPSAGPDGDPTSGPNGDPTAGPTGGPSTAPPSGPGDEPTPTQPEDTTPVQDEGLLTITSYGDGNGGGSPAGLIGARPLAVAAPADQRLLTLTVPAGNTKPVVVSLKYGTALSWPVGPNPAGWTCVRKAGDVGGTCTAKTPGSPKKLRLTFARPAGGSITDRTFVVSAKSGRLYDDDSETLVAPQKRAEEGLVQLSTYKPDPDLHLRTITVVPPANQAATAVSLSLRYGASLAWPLVSNPPGWKCNRAKQTCTASAPRRPAPLLATFAVPTSGSASARTYSVTATAGLLYDTDAETLAAVRLDENLMRIYRPGLLNDPNWFAFNRFVSIRGTTGRVTVQVAWGRNVAWLTAVSRGWVCTRTGVRSGTCWTNAYSRPLNTEWKAYARGNGPDNRVTLRTSAGGRYDVDTFLIPPGHGL